MLYAAAAAADKPLYAVRVAEKRRNALPCSICYRFCFLDGPRQYRGQGPDSQNVLRQSYSLRLRFGFAGHCARL